MPLSSRVRSPATGTGRPQRRDQVGAHQHLATTGRRGDAGGPGDGGAEVVTLARGRPRRRGARCARWARSRARRDVGRGPAGSPPRTRCRRRAAPKATKNPSPPCFTSSPRQRANSARRVRSCQRSSCSQTSSPIASASRVDSTMSEKRKVRTGSRGRLVARRSDVEVDHRTDLLCRTGGGLDLEASAGLVAICHQRAGQPHARLGGFVGSVDLAPRADAFLQRADGCRGVATVEGQLATRHRGGRGRSGRAEPSRQLLELGDALAGRRLIADRQARGHVHRQHEDPALPRQEPRVGQGTGEAPHCALRVASRQEQAAPPGLAVVAEGHRLGERFLGPRQVAAANPDVDQLAVPPGGAEAVDRPQLLAGPQDPLLGLGQLPVDAIDLALVEAAQPRVPVDRLALAVAGRHVRPLRRPPPVAESPTDRDHRAVHVAGVDRRDARPHGQGGGLVQERQHLAAVALGDGDVRQPLHRHRLQAGAPHPASDGVRLLERRPRPLDVACRHLGERQRPHRLRVLRRLGLSLEELPRRGRSRSPPPTRRASARAGAPAPGPCAPPAHARRRRRRPPRPVRGRSGTRPRRRPSGTTTPAAPGPRRRVALGHRHRAAPYERRSSRCGRRRRGRRRGAHHARTCPPVWHATCRGPPAVTPWRTSH